MRVLLTLGGGAGHLDPLLRAEIDALPSAEAVVPRLEQLAGH